MSLYYSRVWCDPGIRDDDGQNHSCSSRVGKLKVPSAASGARVGRQIRGTIKDATTHVIQWESEDVPLLFAGEWCRPRRSEHTRAAPLHVASREENLGVSQQPPSSC